MSSSRNRRSINNDVPWHTRTTSSAWMECRKSWEKWWVRLCVFGTPKIWTRLKPITRTMRRRGKRIRVTKWRAEKRRISVWNPFWVAFKSWNRCTQTISNAYDNGGGVRRSRIEKPTDRTLRWMTSNGVGSFERRQLPYREIKQLPQRVETAPTCSGNERQVGGRRRLETCLHLTVGSVVGRS